MLKHLLALVVICFFASLVDAALPTHMGEPCSRGHKGILFHAKDPSDLSKGCHVTAILKKDCLQLFRGSSQYAKIDLDAIETPIQIVPYDRTCLSIKTAKNNPEVFCCDSEACRDAWWIAMTEQILCLHKGKMRNEISGEPSVEEEEREVLEEVVTDPKKGGITIHIERGTAQDEPTVMLGTH